MHGGTRNQPARPEEGKRALAFVHQLLSGEENRIASLNGLLAELAQAFGVSGAGLAGGPAGTPVARVPSARAWPALWPWQQQPEVLEQLRQAPSAITLAVAEGGSLLAASAGPGDCNGWLLWRVASAMPLRCALSSLAGRVSSAAISPTSWSNWGP